MNIFQWYREQRRVKIEEKLISLNKDIDKVSERIRDLKNYRDPLSNFSNGNDYGRECREDSARIDDIRRNESLLHPLSKKRDKLRKKLSRL